MRTTVDIPDTTYRALKSRAASEGASVKELLLRGAHIVLEEAAKQTQGPALSRLSGPPCVKGTPGSLHLTNEMIYDLIDLP